jgi:tol-pal system protein YbgF
MKKRILNFILLASVTPFLVQCASQTDLDDLRYQLRLVNKKVEDMKANTVDQLQRRQAAASGQVDQVELDILELKSQLEETYHLNQRLKEQNKELEATISNVVLEEASKREEALKQFEESQRAKEVRLTEVLNEKLRLQQESVNAIQKARIREAERRAKDAALAAELAKTRSKSANSNLRSPSGIKHIQANQKKIKRSVVAKASPRPNSQNTQKKLSNNTSSTQTSSPVKKSIATEQQSDDFTKAGNLYKRGKFKQAQQLFGQVASNTSSPNNVDARFMMGECLFNQKEYDKAIMQYQNIISQHSNHPKTPEAMLQQGIAFEKLADKETAKVIYKKLLKKYSSSPEAKIAQKKLSNP